MHKYYLSKLNILLNNSKVNIAKYICNDINYFHQSILKFRIFIEFHKINKESIGYLDSEFMEIQGINNYFDEVSLVRFVK